MKKLFFILLTCIFSISLIVGCGGGGGGGTPVVVDTTAAAGLWVGTVTDATGTNDFIGVASTNGKFRFLIDSGICAGTQYSGTFSMNNNTGSGTVTGYIPDGICYYTNDTKIISGPVSFTISGTNLTGTALTGGDSGNFDLTYNPIANSPITFADLEGNWGYNFGGPDFFTITVSGNGSFTGIGGSGCNMSGQLSIIDPDWSITNISVTASNCNETLLNGTYTGLGLLVFDPGGDIFVLMASKSDLSYFDFLDRLPSINLNPETISAGRLHNCGIKEDGTVVCWGAGTTNTGLDNEYGQSIPPAGTFTQISAGSRHTCGIKTDGTVACWGDNESGKATPPAGTFTQISAGHSATCGVQTNGTIACWGVDVYGQLSSPVGIFVQVSGGFAHYCGVQTNGIVACWGNGTTNSGVLYDYGQAIPPAGTFIEINSGSEHTCGIKTDETVVCWGAGTTNTGVDWEYGQSIAPAGTFTQISAGENHTCGLQTDGTVACWGSNDFDVSIPPAETFTQVSAGGGHNCGEESDGTVTCWGYNAYGQATPPADLRLW